MRRQVLKKKVYPQLMKTIIKLYDFERSLPFPTAESVLQLEQFFWHRPSAMARDSQQARYNTPQSLQEFA